MVDFTDPKKDVVVDINGYGRDKYKKVPDIVVYSNDGGHNADRNHPRMSRLAKSGSAQIFEQEANKEGNSGLENVMKLIEGPQEPY